MFYELDFLGKEYFNVSANLSNDWFQPLLAISFMLPEGVPEYRKENLVSPLFS
jgi:5-hydroxyisourate hydrolase-like protein (transthyretin family)